MCFEVYLQVHIEEGVCDDRQILPHVVPPSAAAGVDLLSIYLSFGLRLPNPVNTDLIFNPDNSTWIWGMSVECHAVRRGQSHE